MVNVVRTCDGKWVKTGALSPAWPCKLAWNLENSKSIGMAKIMTVLECKLLISSPAWGCQGLYRTEDLRAAIATGTYKFRTEYSANFEVQFKFANGQQKEGSQKCMHALFCIVPASPQYPTNIAATWVGGLLSQCPEDINKPTFWKWQGFLLCDSH